MKPIINLSIKMLWLLLCLVLVACNRTDNLAPVVNKSLLAGNIYVVQPGDTLYSIAFGAGRDYRQLAAVNHIRSPYRIQAGQRIHLSAKATSKTQSPKQRLKTASNKKGKAKRTHASVNPSAVHWQWPVRGRVIKRFTLSKPVNAGINISGKPGQAVRATAKGQVVYSGNGVFGYGNLLIVQHNQDYLSAYAHNQKNLVREGQWVKPGQTIALMGQSGAVRVMLHFEIRKNGKPVNPINYLPR